MSVAGRGRSPLGRTRGHFAAAFACAGVALAGCDSGSSESPRSDASADAPNIVMVMTDDQTKDQYSARSMPFTWRYMREHGTTFTNYLVTSPLCCPARAGIITGQYGHNNGVLANTYLLLRAPEDVLPVWLSGAGYRTAHVGKFLNNYGKALDDPAEVMPGWDHWFTQLEPQRYYDYEISDDGEPVRYGDTDRDYLTRVVNERATRLIQSWAADGDTFFLALDAFAPHFGAGARSGRCKGAAVPDPRDEGRFEGATVPAGASLDERNVADKPGFVRSLPRASAFRRAKANRHYGCALASLRAVDRGMRDIVRTLEETGTLDDTVIVFTSDNGYFYGEHRIAGGKEAPYRETYEVPLQIRLPPSLIAERVPSTDAEVANIDLAPTFLELAGARPCRDEGRCREPDGRSLLPLLNAVGSDARSWPRHRPRGLELDVSGAGGSHNGVCTYYGARSGRWVYIRHERTVNANGDCAPSGEVELYDLRRDPRQLENVADREPAVRHRLERLSRRIRRCTGSAGSDDSSITRDACP